MLTKLLPLLLLGLGVFTIVQVLLPFVSYEFWEFTTYNQNQSLISPSSDSQVLGVSIKNVDNFPAIYSQKKRNGVVPYREFFLSIPSINLNQARVKVDSNDFDYNLAQLPGSALPGEVGNLFITGHSSLPQLFDSQNYKTIFTHLTDVKKGDAILIDVGGQRFNYIVEGLKVVDPSDLGVINPPDKLGRYITLMTCVPPGLYLKRLIVLGELQ